MCHRSINYIAEMMETKFGIPWIKVNFIGAEATAKSLRKIATFFDDPKLTARVEEVIAREMIAVGRRAGRRKPHPRQDRRAVCRRFPGASLPGFVPRHRHGNHFRRLRVRPPRRLRRPQGAADSRWTPTAATSRNCTSSRTRTLQPRRRRADTGRLEAGGSSSRITRA